MRGLKWDTNDLLSQHVTRFFYIATSKMASLVYKYRFSGSYVMWSQTMLSFGLCDQFDWDFFGILTTQKCHFNS